MNIKYRNYEPNDEHKICMLYRQVFNAEMSYYFWQWRYQKNPFGNLNISLCFDGDRLVGHYAVSPINFICNGEIIKGAQSMTTMVDPEYQGLRIFSTLAEQQYAKLKMEKYAFVWGFPNRNSYYGFIQHLNWHPVMEIPFLICKTPKTEYEGSFKVTHSSPTESEIRNLMGFSSRAKSFELHRTIDYISWRYDLHPKNKYEKRYFYKDGLLTGMIITKNYMVNGEIYLDLLELMAIDENCTKNILLWMRYYFLNIQNVQGIYAWSSIHDVNYLAYFQNGFLAQSPMTYLGALSFYNSNIDQFLPTNWVISMGDSDVF